MHHVIDVSGKPSKITCYNDCFSALDAAYETLVQNKTTFLNHSMLLLFKFIRPIMLSEFDKKNNCNQYIFFIDPDQ